MATTPGLTESMASNVVDIYAQAELILLEKMAKHAANGVDTPEYELKQLQNIQAYTAEAKKVIAQAQKATTAATVDAIQVAEQYGISSATAELGEALKIQPNANGILFKTHDVAAMAQAQLTQQANTHFQLLSKSQDMFRQVIAESSSAALLGVETGKQAMQRALNEFAHKGITVYTNARGAQYEVASYVEMSMRTTLMNSALQGHANKLEKAGMDLIIVSDHTQECKRCRVYEGKILSMSGKQRGHIEVTGATGKQVKLHVFASLKEAKAGGLFHPNCRHTFTAYIPGITKSFGETADPQGDADRQKLRKLERETRALRRIEAVTPDGEKQEIKARIKAKRAQIADHVENTSAKRQPDRERISGLYAGGDPSKVIKKPKKVTPPAAPKPVKIPDVNTDAIKDVDFTKPEKTQLTGSFAPKIEKTQLTGSFAPKLPEKKTQLTGSFAPKPPPAVPASKPVKKAAQETIASAAEPQLTMAEMMAKMKAAKMAQMQADIDAKPKPKVTPAVKQAVVDAAAPKAPRRKATTGGVPGVHDVNAKPGTSDNPRHFGTSEEGKAYASQLHENEAGKWPKGMGAAIRHYTGEAYTRMNGWARKGGVGRKPAHVDNLDAAFEHVPPLQEWLITTRGTNGLELGLDAKVGLKELKAMVGKDHTQPGYMSTSVKNRPAFPGHIQMIVRNPPGSRGIYVDGAPGQRGNSLLTVNQGEDEFLLPRNTKYRIVSVEKGTNGFVHNLVVEVIV